MGFATQLDAYFPDIDPRVRPDFRIWLPASKDYIYLEFKLVAWGKGWDYYYKPAIKDIEKLVKYTNQQNQKNGLIAVGFSKTKEWQVSLKDRFEELSQNITKDYPYEKIGLKCTDLQGMDEHSSYAMIGMWFRKS